MITTTTPAPGSFWATGHPCLAWISTDPETDPRVGHRCLRKDPDKPMCFRGEPWCSANHRKIVEATR